MLIAIFVVLVLILLLMFLIMLMVATITSDVAKKSKKTYEDAQADLFKAWGDSIIQDCRKKE